jgi:hypothetical protein
MNQWHSCLATSVDQHFAGVDPAVRKTYDTPIGRLKELGPLRVEAVKSSINLASKYHFRAVSVRPDHLRLGFILDREIEHQRIIRTETVGSNRVGHHVMLSTPEDVNSQLMEWLSRAYRLQARQ